MRYSHMTVMLRCDWFSTFLDKIPIAHTLKGFECCSISAVSVYSQRSYYTVTGYTATTIFDRVTEACDEKRIKKTETAKQSTTWQAKQLGSTYMGGDQ